jgi:hypothetical protein
MHQRGALKGQAAVGAGSFLGRVIAVEAEKTGKKRDPKPSTK